jgi:hypothetical protein
VLPIRRAHKGVRTPAHTAWRAAPLARICGAEGATLARPLGARSLALPSAGRVFPHSQEQPIASATRRPGLLVARRALLGALHANGEPGPSGRRRQFD